MNCKFKTYNSLIKFFYSSLLLLFFIANSPLAKAQQSPDEVFEQANSYYKEAYYDSAFTLYSILIEGGYESAELYYNCGNSAFKLKLIPDAIWNYEKALLLKPGDNDITHNLEIVTLLIKDKIEVIPVFFLKEWASALISIFDTDTWSVIALTLLWICLAMFVLMMLSKRAMYKKNYFLMGIIVFSMFLAFHYFAYSSHENRVNNQFAIVFSPSVTVKSEPGIKATDLFVIHEGIKVQLIDKEDNWIQVKLSDGKQGWINISTVKFI